jgi:hypothetical protein
MHRRIRWVNLTDRQRSRLSIRIERNNRGVQRVLWLEHPAHMAATRASAANHRR